MARSKQSAAEIQTRILDAAMDALAQQGIAALRHQHIIDGSGLARQTVYNHFANRDEVLRALFEREGRRICEDCARHIRPYKSAAECFVQGFLYVYRVLPNNAMLAQIVEGHAAFLALMTPLQTSMSDYGRWCFGDVFEAWPALQDDIEGISDYWSRSLVSVLIFMGANRSDTEVEAYVRKRLLPGLRLEDYGC